VTDVRYIPPNSAEWRSLATNPKLRSSLRVVGRKAMGHMKELAASHTDTGNYEHSFQVVDSTTIINGHPRASVEVQNTSPHAAALEWGNNGNRHTPSQRHSTPALIFTRTLLWLDAQ
jgi:hypothetical protein